MMKYTWGVKMYQKRVPLLFLQELWQMYTDFNNSFTVLFSDLLEEGGIKTTTYLKSVAATTLRNLNAQLTMFHSRQSISL